MGQIDENGYVKITIKGGSVIKSEFVRKEMIEQVLYNQTHRVNKKM